MNRPNQKPRRSPPQEEETPEPPVPEPEAPAEPQPEEDTPEPPVPEPEAPAEPPQEQETQPPQSTTLAQEFAEWKQETGLNGRVVARVSRVHAMEAEYGSLRHVVARLVSLAVLVQYIAAQDLYHLPKTQTRIDRVIPNTPYYRSAVGLTKPSTIAVRLGNGT